MSRVVIEECKSYEVENIISKVDDGIEKLGGWSKFVKPGDKVLLKVNLIGPKTPESGAVTNCEFVRALVRILKRQNCIVWIGDSAGGAIGGIAPTAQALNVSGLVKVAKEEGAEIKNFDKEGVVPVSLESKLEDTMYIAKPMKDPKFTASKELRVQFTFAAFSMAAAGIIVCLPDRATKSTSAFSTPIGMVR